MDQKLRPTFDDIFREFQVHDFAILPDADQFAIAQAASEVLAFEQNPVPRHVSPRRVRFAPMPVHA
jgi:hypothetical protein